MENEPKVGGSFVSSRLPWLAGGAALVFYLCTLNHWISFANMAQVAKVSGYSWNSEVFSPLYYAVSAPLRLLPPSWAPLAVNLFSALCAALALTLLARAVMLLPHDRTNAQREREKSDGALLSVPLAWLPPLLAVLVCGLQLTFWEHATNGTPDMLNLLCFAYVVRALLEYRRDEREAWLYKAALAYGAVMTSEWFMVAAFPAFLTAVIWMRGLSFFNLRFLGRMMLCGLLGLSLYLLLPTLGALSSTEPINFWQALKVNLLSERNFVLMFPRKMMFLMLLTSLLPVFVLSLRSSSRSSDTSPLGVSLAAVVFHIVHALFLVVCLWVMLDPQFSPRHSGFGVPFLNLYFLSALSVGYFSGYFLLVFRPLAVRGRRPTALALLLNRVATAGVIILAVIVPVLLLIKNLPVIRTVNQSLLKDFAGLTGEGLPQRGYLVADDPRRALIARVWLAQAGRDRDFVVVEGLSLALGSPAYHRYMRRQYGERWPATVEAKRTAPLDLAFTVDLLNRFAKAGELFYLHPSFGLFFEHFYAEPHGLLFKLQPFAADALLPPPLSPQLVAENEAFWERASQKVFPDILSAIAPHRARTEPNLRDRLITLLHLVPEPPGEARAAGSLYSRSLNYWAVELQKTGDFEKAAGHFDLAQKLNPDNVVAQTNLEFNNKYRAGQRPPVEMPRTIEDRIGSWDQVLSQNGPYDEPSLCYAQGFAFVPKGLYRQAAQAFERVHALAPEDIPTRLYLGELNLLAQKPDRALELTRDILKDPERFGATATNRADALCLEAKAYFIRREPERAEALLETAIQAAPADDYLLTAAVSVYTDYERYSNALVNVERQLKRHPENPAVLLNKGAMYIRLKVFDGAIRTMTQVLALQSNKSEALPDDAILGIAQRETPRDELRSKALLNRAIAYLGSDQLDLAQKDYESLQQLYPGARQVYYGLGEIAFRRKDTNTAIKHCESYLSNAVPGAPETRDVEARLKELRGARSLNR